MDGTLAPLVRVIVLNYNGWADTLECLESVFRQDHPRLQVVVCDNQSGDGSVERIRAWAEGRLEAEGGHLAAAPVPKPIAFREYSRAEAEAGGGEDDASVPLILIRTGGNLGFAGGNNVALRYSLARGDAAYAWLLNNDAVADPEALRRMVELAAADATVGMVGSKLLHYDDPGVIQAVAGGRLIRWQGMTRYLGRDEVDRGQWAEPVEPDYVTGASLLIPTPVVEEVGLMDERYFLYSEEVDWCLRVKATGRRLLYCPGSRVWHKEGRSVVYKSAFHDYHSVRSSLLLVEKHYPALLPVAALHSVFRCVLPKLARMQWGRVEPVLRAYRDVAGFLRAGRGGRAGAAGRAA